MFRHGVRGRIGHGGKRKADPQGLALILTGRRCTLAAMRERGVGVMRVAVPFRAGGAAASAHASQAERAAELACRARFMPGWRAQRRREGLKPAGPGQPAGPGRSPKARRRSRHAKVSPYNTAMESQSGQDGSGRKSVAT